MSLKTTKENYNKAKSIYLEIDDAWSKLQSGDLEDSDFQINQLLLRIKDLKKALQYIDLNDLEGNYPQHTIDAVTKNAKLFNEAVYFIERFLLQSKYTKSLLDPIRLKYLPDMHLSDDEIEKWGGDLDKVAKKFIGAITHRDNIKEYENKIKRMAVGTMTIPEFKRIFDVIKHKMVVSPKKFESLANYKNDNES